MKNYDLYYNKILDYAKLCGVVVYWSKDDLDYEHFGEFSEKSQGRPHAIYITVDRAVEKTYKKKYVLACMLHELGHYEDSLKFKKFYSLKNLDKAYVSYQKSGVCTPNQKRLILKCETMAWDQALVIAKKLNIPVGKWFSETRASALGIYASIPTI